MMIKGDAEGHLFNQPHIHIIHYLSFSRGTHINLQFCLTVEIIEEEEVYLPRHRFVKARGHPPQTLQKYRIAFATSHKAPEQIHKLLF